MDEALGLPTEHAATIALRTQQIIAHESGAADVIDPLGGSFYIESLTDELETRAKQYLERIESLGGVVACIESGWIQNEIQGAAYQYQKDVDAKREIIVGVNDFVQELNPPSPLKISEAVAREQIARLKRFKEKRNAKRVQSTLDAVQTAAEGTANLMPLFIDAVESGATLGEISDRLRKVFGQYRESIKL
jgi:methylmalonyl-CoA mutase N-terminal domain/subunit